MSLPPFIINHMPALRASAAIGNTTAERIITALQQFDGTAPAEERARRMDGIHNLFDSWMKAEQERTS